MAGQDFKDTVILEVKLTGSGGKPVSEGKKEVDAVAGSIIGLQQATKKLREERNRIDTTTAEGIAKIKELNDQIDKNTDLIKENSSNLEKQRMNVGNYKRGVTDALKELRIGGINIGEVVDKLGKANEDLFQGMISGYKQSSIQAKLFGNAARTALTLTGIGVFVAALATIVAYWDDIKVAIGLADSEQQRFYQHQQEGIERSKKLLDAYNESMGILNELLSIQGGKEEEIFENKRKSLLLEIEIARQFQDNAKKRFDSYVQENNLTAEQIKLKEQVLKITGIRDPMLDKLRELKNQFGEASKAYVDLLNQLALIDAQQAKFNEESEKKASEDQKKKDEERRKESEAKAKEEAARAEAEMKQRLKTVKQFEDFEKESQEEIYKSAVKWKEKEVEAEKKKKEAIVKNKREEVEGINAAIDASVNFARTAFGQMKAFAIAETIINTVRGIVRALADYAFPYNLIVGALVGAAGTVQTARIAGVKFGLGGFFKRYAEGGEHIKVGGLPHSQGGTKFVGTDGSRFEAERGEGIYIMKRTAENQIHELSRHNQKHGGNSWLAPVPGMTSYAMGGEVALSSTKQQNQDTSGIISAIQRMKIYVAVEDINTGQGQYAQVISGSQF